MLVCTTSGDGQHGQKEYGAQQNIPQTATHFLLSVQKFSLKKTEKYWKSTSHFHNFFCVCQCLCVYCLTNMDLLAFFNVTLQHLQ